MSATGKLIKEFVGRPAYRPLKIIGASGQLGYGIPTPAFQRGLEQFPDLIGCDMGSIDIGPYYLGCGQMATARASTKRDLRKVILGARKLDIPLIIGSAGSAGAAPHLEQTIEIIREIAKEDHLSFRMAIIPGDVPKSIVERSIIRHEIVGVDGMPDLSMDELALTTNLVGQMGMSDFQKAIELDIDILIAGRACDTAIFSALPVLLGFDIGLSIHMAKIIECASLCCTPGGRDSILATLNKDYFELESMAPQRKALPMSIAAHSLYEQNDPFLIIEPEGFVDLHEAKYEQISDRSSRISGAKWIESKKKTIKLEGSSKVGERAVLLCGAADPKFIANHEMIFREVEKIVEELVCEDIPKDYQLYPRIYGINGVTDRPIQSSVPDEVFLMIECIAPTLERASEVVRTTKQYLLHYGYPNRLSTGGNIAFPFTPPEVSIGTAYKFNVYHIIDIHGDENLFEPSVIEL